jgi:hypothetical protein
VRASAPLRASGAWAPHSLRSWPTDGCVPGSTGAETGLASDTEWVPPARFSGPFARRAEPAALEPFGQPVGVLAAAGLQD